MFWIVFLFYTAWADCPIAQCQPLSVGECAKKESGKVHINGYGCTKDKTCLASEFENWYSSSETVLMCTDEPESSSSSNDVECGTRDKNQMLAKANGEYVLHPKRCNSDSDCLLQNGSTSPCKCGLDGYSYCSPQWGSEVFDDYWEYCDAGDGKVKFEIYEYYRDLHDNYPYFILAPDCARNIIEELKGLATKPDCAVLAAVVLSLIYLL